MSSFVLTTEAYKNAKFPLIGLVEADVSQDAPLLSNEEEKMVNSHTASPQDKKKKAVRKTQKFIEKLNFDTTSHDKDSTTNQNLDQPGEDGENKEDSVQPNLLNSVENEGKIQNIADVDAKKAYVLLHDSMKIIFDDSDDKDLRKSFDTGGINKIFELLKDEMTRLEFANILNRQMNQTVRFLATEGCYFF